MDEEEQEVEDDWGPYAHDEAVQRVNVAALIERENAHIKQAQPPLRWLEALLTIVVCGLYGYLAWTIAMHRAAITTPAPALAAWELRDEWPGGAACNPHLVVDSSTLATVLLDERWLHRFPCLCVHHTTATHRPEDTPCACRVGARAIYPALLPQDVRPHPEARQVRVAERSIACGRERHEHWRWEHVTIDHTHTPETEEASLCIQMALEEMHGQYQCGQPLLLE